MNNENEPYYELWTFKIEILLSFLASSQINLEEKYKGKVF